MSRWFRFYDEALNDKKVQRLAPHLFKTWINLLCLASKGAGKIPNDDDIAFELRISVQDAKQQVEDLILAGLIDIQPDGARAPHNWEERQFISDTSVERTRKYRERLKKKSSDVTVTPVVTPPESESESDTDTENKLLPSEQVAARSDELGINIFHSMKGEGKNGKSDRMETVKRQAEGLGLDVDEIVGVIKRNKVKNQSAYFTTLCVNRLKDKLPRMPEATLREAIWGNEAAFGRVSAALVGFVS